MVKQNILLTLYIILMPILFFGYENDIRSVELFFKPVFLIVLLRYAYLDKKIIKGKNLFLYALFFSWLGDVTLMFQNALTWMFIIGLLAFLIAHLFYIKTFFRLENLQGMASKFTLGIFALYAFGLMSFLWNGLGGLKLPVSIYSLVLTIMAWAAVSAGLKQKNHFLIWGGLLFVVSDSLLAYNKFIDPITHGSVLILSTYLFAQLGLTVGFFREKP